MEKEKKQEENPSDNGSKYNGQLHSFDWTHAVVETFPFTSVSLNYRWWAAMSYPLVSVFTRPVHRWGSNNIGFPWSVPRKTILSSDIEIQKSRNRIHAWHGQSEAKRDAGSGKWHECKWNVHWLWFNIARQLWLWATPECRTADHFAELRDL